MCIPCRYPSLSAGDPFTLFKNVKDVCSIPGICRMQLSVTRFVFLQMALKPGKTYWKQPRRKEIAMVIENQISSTV